MILLERTYTRPNTLTAWHGTVVVPPGEFIDRLNEYRMSGKIIFSDSISEDNDLSIKFTMTFDSEESYQEYDNDPILTPYWEYRKEYNDSVGIIMGPKILTTV
jgi:hypothetical protein